jgi:hypothetical protein
MMAILVMVAAEVAVVVVVPVVLDGLDLQVLLDKGVPLATLPHQVMVMVALED